MLQNKKFYTSLNNVNSNQTLSLADGLQQGTVTAPDLFNFYNSDIPNLFGIPESEDTKVLFFADDLIIYIKGKNVLKLQDSLQNLFDKINNYYHTWKLKINPLKCEIILFRTTAKKYFL